MKTRHTDAVLAPKQAWAG